MYLNLLCQTLLTPPRKALLPLNSRLWVGWEEMKETREEEGRETEIGRYGFVRGGMSLGTAFEVSKDS